MSSAELTEEWRPIPGYEGIYEASSLGRIRSIDRIVVDNRNTRLFKGKIRNPQLNKGGYYLVSLSKNGVPKMLLVHRQIMLTFVGEPGPDQVCCHNNGDRTDNRLENLRWDTRSSNELDKIKHGNHRANWSHCRRGHPFDAENTRIRKDGYRMCRECNRMMKRAWHHRTKERRSPHADVA